MPLQADLRSAGAYLYDKRSQLLALQDALQSGNGPAVARVFAAVALANGIEKLAAEAATERSALFDAIKDPSHPDLPLLAYVAARLAASGDEDDSDSTTSRL